MPRVLVIEDDRFNRRLYRDLLEEQGLDVDVVASAAEGLAAAAEAPPDLIIMDIELPGMNGLEATRRLVAAKATAHVPVLIISAHAMGDQAAAATAAGAAGFLTKPLDFPLFQETVCRLSGAPME